MGSVSLGEAVKCLDSSHRQDLGEVVVRQSRGWPWTFGKSERLGKRGGLDLSLDQGWMGVGRATSVYQEEG